MTPAMTTEGQKGSGVNNIWGPWSSRVLQIRYYCKRHTKCLSLFLNTVINISVQAVPAVETWIIDIAVYFYGLTQTFMLLFIEGQSSFKDGDTVANLGRGGGLMGSGHPFGPRCRLFNIGPKAEPPGPRFCMETYR